MAGLIVSLSLTAVGCGKSNVTESAVGQSMANDVLIESSGNEYTDAKVINLSVESATIDSAKIEEFDYTWNCDPSVTHDEVDDAPAEFYTGSKPDTEEAVYIDHELYYYPSLDASGFKKIQYDGEQEWAYYYTDGTNDEYIFATLPSMGQSLPTSMMHSAEEAADNKVLHITEAGTYVLTGSWKGQVKVDLGEDSFSDESMRVTLILDGADIECTVAPGVIFEQVYECDNTWEEEERTDATVDTTSAGANIVLADGSKNYILGENVFRMLKTKYKDEDSTDEIKLQKKMRKTDGALYSYMTMNIDGQEDGTGKLTVDSGFEGIDSELHLTVNGGNVTVNSQDDGMNVNEDHVSVLSLLGGEVTLNAALGEEGDGIDSNGYILVDGGTININGIRVPDSALDSEDGIYYQSGTIVMDGETQEYTKGEVFNETGRKGLDPNVTDGNDASPKGGFMNSEASDEFDINEFKEKVAELDDDATIEDVMKLLGIGMGGNRPDNGAANMEPPAGGPQQESLHQ